MGKWESTGKRVGNLFIKKRLIPKTGILVQIITVFSCKLQGKRANKAKKLIRELIQEETDGKSHKSNADTKQCTEN